MLHCQILKVSSTGDSELDNDGSKAHGQTIIAAERRRRILNRIQKQGSVNVSDLAVELNVGVTTIRQDLNTLHEQGKVLRSHGGAIARDKPRPSLPYSQTRSERMGEKSSIATAAIEFIPEAGRFFIGPGTTTLQFTKMLPEGHGFRIATNSLEVALHLAYKQIATIDFFGGTVRAESLAVDISASNPDLENLYWDACFLGAAAVDIVRGITTLDQIAMQWERKVLEHSSKRIILCDSSKIGTFAYAKVCPVSMIDILITDNGIDADVTKQFTENGVQVVTTSIDSEEPDID